MGLSRQIFLTYHHQNLKVPGIVLASGVFWYLGQHFIIKALNGLLAVPQKKKKKENK